MMVLPSPNVTVDHPECCIELGHNLVLDQPAAVHPPETSDSKFSVRTRSGLP